MVKRRRDQTPRLSPLESRLRWLRIHVAQIGEPSRISVAETLKQLADCVAELGELSHKPLLSILRAVVFEQPHKIALLAKLVFMLEKNVKFLVIEMAADETQKALQTGDATRAKLFLRFLCALHPLIANLEVITNTLLNFARTKNPLLCHAALLAAFYLPNVPQQLRDLLAETPEVGGSLPFYGEKAPYTAMDMGALCAEVATKEWLYVTEQEEAKETEKTGPEKTEPEKAEPEKAESEETNVKEEPEKTEPEKPESEKPESEEPAETEKVEPEDPEKAEVEHEDADGNIAIGEPDEKITIDPFDTTFESLEKLSPPLYFQCYFPISGVDMVPPPNTALGLLIRDVAVDVIRHLDYNRREATRQLIALDLFFDRKAFAPPGAPPDQLVATHTESAFPQYKVEDIALEAVFALLFDLDKSPPELPAVYFHSLLIEACVCAPQDIAPVLGRGLRFLFNNLESADAQVLFLLVDWFAHHVSNFSYTWKWSEWEFVLSLPRWHPQQVFVHELVKKQVRLSYPQRIAEVLPDEFKPLVPSVPEVPEFQLGETEEGKALLNALSETDTEGMLAAAAEVLKNSQQSERLLTTTVCHLGNRSVTHAKTWIAKTESLFQQFGADHSKVIAAVFDYWSESEWVGALIVQQLIRLKLLTPADFVAFVLKNQSLLISSLGFECLMAHINEAAAEIDNIKLEGKWADWWEERLKRMVKRRHAIVCAAESNAKLATKSTDTVPEPQPAAEKSPEHSPEPEEDDGAPQAKRARHNGM